MRKTSKIVASELEMINESEGCTSIDLSLAFHPSLIRIYLKRFEHVQDKN